MSRARNQDNKEAFNFYDSWESYYDDVLKGYDETPNSYGGKGAIERTNPSSNPDWYGTDSLSELQGTIKDFIDKPALDSIIDNVKDLFSTISLGGAFEKDRFIATAMPIGIFDFSLASQGLYKPQEYYSPELDKLIDPNSVRKIQEDPTIFVYYGKEGFNFKAYVLVQQQEGTFCMDKKDKYIKKLLSEGTEIKLAKKIAKKQFPNCRLVFRTTTRKVYLTRSINNLAEDEAGGEKYVDIVAPIGGLSNQTPRSLMYSVMPSLLLVYFLNNAGIKTRVLGANLTRGGDYRTMEAFVIKDYDENLDFNRVAILTADSRIFRYKIFKGIVRAFNKYFNIDVGSGLGSQLSGNARDKQFERYKKWYIDQIKEGAKVFNKNRRLMFMSGFVASPSDSDDALMEQAKTEFFKILDAIDLEFNGARVSLPRIRERDEKRGIDPYSVRARLQGTLELATIYDDSDSKFSSTDEEIEKMKNLKTKLRADINQVMSEQN